MREAFLRVGTRAVASLVFLLLVAGALVTSTDSGLAVPDWPLSYGKVMPPMVGGILYEHGHRLVAAGGLYTRGAGVRRNILFLERKRKTLKLLAGVAFGTILLQALLGGLTVLFLLPPAISSAHAALAEIVFALTAVVALMCSKTWADLTKAPPDIPFKEILSSPSSSSLSLPVEENSSGFLRRVKKRTAPFDGSPSRPPRSTSRSCSAPSCATRAPDSRSRTSRPSFGGLLPSHSRILSRPGVADPARAPPRRDRGSRPRRRRRPGPRRASTRAPLFASFAATWAGLVSIQLLLGALSVWSRKDPVLTTAHLATGALCWVTGVLALVCLGASRNPPNALSSPGRA